MLGLARSDTFAGIADGWRQMVGADLAALSEPQSLRNEILVVAVSDPAVADHLRWAAPDLVAAINAVSGGRVVQRIDVKITR